MRLLRSDTLKIGGKPVKVGKITIAQWRELFNVINTLPQLLISILVAPQADRLPTFIVAIENSLDDVVNVVSVLTGLDAEWIEQNASIDELVAFFTATARANNFGDVLKNVQSALKLANPETTADQGAE
ncbi:hypothetical protein DCC85_14265 [Paenibacillus sp. CAA11]|uniref:hypothetical protein n=1 Tax=Paenibacillus sp. CAA11 TaxID=1532905 RepID=UPI000D33B573|nr:hypothetical protein [Paenibacillus sp. CAA11]AWB45274.1 hypothetical protein DCC85_14265 [Paenibacillus sp. CAA11]